MDYIEIVRKIYDNAAREESDKLGNPVIRTNFARVLSVETIITNERISLEEFETKHPNEYSVFQQAVRDIKLEFLES